MSVNDLPNPILLHIISHLNLEEWCACFNVSHHFREVALLEIDRRIAEMLVLEFEIPNPLPQLGHSTIKASFITLALMTMICKMIEFITIPSLTDPKN
jgi:hypothetical protein